MRITNQVENILKAVPKTRDDDRELIIIYMQKAGMELTDRQLDVFRGLPAFETITRVRRQLQEQGKYPASPEVDKARFEKYKKTKAEINYTSAEEALEQQGRVILPWGQ